MNDEDEFVINNPNWRDKVTNEPVMLGGTLEASEYEIMLAIEVLTPIIKKKYNRAPNEADIMRFVQSLRGND